jgi:hypothetical protein
MVGHPIATYHPTHGVVSHLVVIKFCHCGWSWGAYHPTHCCGWSSGARTIPPMVVVGHQVHGPSHPWLWLVIRCTDHPTHCCGWASGARTIPPIVVVGHRYVPSLICIGEESLWTHCGFHLVPHFGGKFTRCLVFT